MSSTTAQDKSVEGDGTAAKFGTSSYCSRVAAGSEYTSRAHSQS